MKKKNHVSLLCLLCVMALSFSQERETINLQKNWKFKKGISQDIIQKKYGELDWEVVDIPHDWSISSPFDLNGDGNTGKLPWKDEGWYVKELPLPESYRGKRIYIIFDGVMAFPKVYLNGVLVGEWDYGYNSFYIDITDNLKFGESNTLSVHANTKEHDSRWYPGGGIYRKVQLLVINPIHVAVWGTQITTPIIKPHYAEVQISSQILNSTDSEAKIKVEHSILDDDGTEIASGSRNDSIRPNQDKFVELSLKIASPKLWDVDNPLLYTAITNIYVNNTIVDSKTTSFGIRTIQFTPDDGFHLNGRRVQLKGVNLHHGHGPLGAAFYPRAMERQLEIMKSMGVNAIRNSHNVAAPELLELCDKMGLLLFNEIFDKYDNKADITENTDFDEFAHRNIKNFVIRDRNHPSVFLWSVGNEIGDVQWNINGGHRKLRTMVNYLRKYDHTRPITLVNDNMESAVLRHFDYYDVHAWNYGRRYRLARQLEPNKSVVISESASTLSTRGFYEFPLPEEKTDFTNSLQVSSYDLNAPYWAEVADDDFMWQQEEPYIAGEFVWTGFDYLGEPTPYGNFTVKGMGMTDKEASRSSYFGAVDLVGFPKDRYYLYKSHWKPEQKNIHILPHWNWKGKEGDTIPVFVYTNGDSAELFINGISQGIQKKDPTSKNSLERFRLMWNNTIYSPGEVKAIVYKDGKLLGANVLKTSGEPHRLKLTADRSIISSGGMDLSYVTVEAVDKDGNLCPLANNRVSIQVSGAGSLIGVGNGNPQSLEPFSANYVDLFYGKAMLILKSNEIKGRLTVNVESGNLISGRIKINTE